MGLIRLQNVTKQFGDRLVLQDLSLELSTGHIVGLVGSNGAGKSTLLRLITGEIQPDTGSVSVSKGMELGYLPQEPASREGLTLHDEVLSAFAHVLALEQKLQALSDRMTATAPGPDLDELMRQYDRTTARFEAAGGYSYEQRLAEILTGLGFRESDFKLPLTALSGGQRCRAALARLLLAESHFLLLDEPTNHLDIDAVRWLENFLGGHPGGAVIISHDRYLLDRVAEQIFEVENGRIESYPGNYTNYVRARELRRLTQERQYEHARELIEKEREYIRRVGGGIRPTQAKSRLKQLERRLESGEFVLERPNQHATVHFGFAQSAADITTGRNALEARGLTKHYGDKRLFTDLALELPAGRRLGITGPNGTGKTTFLKIALGLVPPDAGEVQIDRKASVGYYAQEATDLDPEKTVIQEIQTVRPDMLESQARSYAARFLFRGEEPFKRVRQLSGGEQSRVRLIKIILTYPNLLVLDEPTNHLDIASREVLEQALLEFSGTIIAVSHDRYFLDRICDRLLVMRDNEDRLFAGNYSFYIEQVERERAEAEAAAQKERREQVRTRSKSAATRARAAALPGARQARSRYARLKMEELETVIMEREAELATLHERFGDPAIYQDPAKIAALRAEFDALQAELGEAEAEWNRRAEVE